jgi:RNA polymerase sigma-70 factor (ECF subfamily)
VTAIGRRILGAGTDVEDLVQDVFLVVHRDLHRLRDRKRLRGWLAIITTRTAHLVLRGRMADRNRLSSDPEAMTNAVSKAPSQEACWAATQRVERLAQLSPELRTAWMLRYWDGESLEQVARVSDCSASTVQRRLRTAQTAIAAE